MKPFRKTFLEVGFTSAVAVLFMRLVAFGAVGINISPSAISNSYVGMVTVQITGLSNGETVLLEKYLDLNANGVLDGPDWLMECAQLTDGYVPKIGGQTHYAVPYDVTGTNGAITALLNFCLPDQLDHFVGRYLFRVLGPSGGATAIFSVTNVPYPQSIAGTVRCAGTNVPYPVVVFLTHDEELAGGVIGAGDGTFTYRLPPGTYLVQAVRPGYLANFANPAVVTLAGGANISTNLELVGATRLLAGRVVNAANTNVGLPGLLLFGMNESGQLTIGTTDTNGYFALPVGTGWWMVRPELLPLNKLGYVGLDEVSLPRFNMTPGNVTNARITVPMATALFYGSVRTLAGAPLAGVSFYGEDFLGEFEADGASDTNGMYAVGVLGGRTWHFGPAPTGSGTLANYLISAGTDTYIGSNQAIRIDFVAAPVTGVISGSVRDASGNPLFALSVYARANIGTNHFDVYTETQFDGTFSMRVADGTWRVGFDCWQLQQRGYQCPSEQVVAVPPTNATVNFTIYPLPPLEITTVTLPPGQVGSYYDAWLSATGGAPPYNWWLESGSSPLPPGLSLSSAGQIFGTPTTNGTFNFTVRVTDSLLNYTTKAFTITVAPRPGLAPVIESPRRLPTGEFQFQFNTLSGATYTLLYSTNLVHWMPIITFRGSGGPITIIDPNTGAPVRFYRVRAQM
ncbi:MAG: putative Ig domain-containing protein [Verrucomicrobiae bacterium]|nr:putative Ig domain-containing protein [Verrucomicrobiae bacterium]